MKNSSSRYPQYTPYSGRNKRRILMILASGIFLAWSAFWLHAMIVKADSPEFDPAKGVSAESGRFDFSGNGSLVGNPATLSYASSVDGRFWVFSSRDRRESADNNGRQDVYLYDPFNDKLELISVGINGLPSNGDSGASAVSADGRWVVFASRAENLMAGATDGRWNIYIKDRQLGEMRRVTKGLNGVVPDGDSFYPTLSADGRRLVFVSYADNLVNGDKNDQPDVFFNDLETGETRLISRGPGGEPALGASYTPVINAAGNTIVYTSKSIYHLTDGSRTDDGPSYEQVFLYDLDTRETRLISSGSDGTPSDGASWVPAISPDGTLVAFASYASNLVPNDTNGVMDVFLYESGNRKINRVSTSPDGSEFAMMSWGPAISTDGRYVRFDSLQPGDENSTGIDAREKPYLFDRKTGRVRVLEDGWKASSLSFLPGEVDSATIANH